MFSTTTLAVVVVGLAVPAPAFAQERAPGPDPVRHLPARDAAVGDGPERRPARSAPSALDWRPHSHLLAGEPISIGADYKATYSAAGMVFTPALGPRARVTRHFAYRFEGASVGGVPLDGLDLAAAPGLVDGEVRFDRGRGLTEVYAAQGRGLAQSFVFERLPSRSGPLVVHGRLATQMPRDTASDSPDTLRFVEPGSAEVRIDTVVGLDAAGRRVPGSLRLDGDRLALTLPAAFVATAELPLVLDPVFGVEHLASAPGFNADGVDIAYGDAGIGGTAYCTVHSRYYSSNDLDIIAGTYDDLGSSQLLPFAIEGDVGFVDTGAAVAYNGEENTFAVVWQRQQGPSGPPTVHASFFSLTSGLVVAHASLGGGRQPDVGAPRDDSDRAVCVFQTGDTVRARDFTVAVGQPIALGTPATVFPFNPFAQGYTRPCISKTANDLGLYLVGTEEGFTPDRDLRLAAVDRFGTVVSDELKVTTVGPDEERPDVAAAQEDFMLVFEREAVPGDGDADVVGRKVDLEPAPFGYAIDFEDDEIGVSAKPFDDEREPAVAVAHHEWVVVWQDEFQGAGTGLYDVYLTTIGRDTCKICEPTQLVSEPVGSNVVPEITSVYEGGTSPLASEAGVAWTRYSGGAPSSIHWRLWRSESTNTTVAVHDDGCPDGGLISLAGNLDLGGKLDFVVSGLAPGVGLAALNLAVPGTGYDCGECSILPLGTTFLGAPALGGTLANVDLPVPCDVALSGETFTFQWIVVGAPSSPCTPFDQVSASNTLSLTLGY